MKSETLADRQSAAMTCSMSFESLVAKLLNGRSWHDLNNIEGCIFDRLQDRGHVRTVRGIVVWTPISANSWEMKNEACSEHEVATVTGTDSRIGPVTSSATRPIAAAEDGSTPSASLSSSNDNCPDAGEKGKADE